MIIYLRTYPTYGQYVLLSSAPGAAALSVLSWHSLHLYKTSLKNMF